MKRVLLICSMLLAFSAMALAAGGESAATATVVGALPYSDSGVLGSTEDCSGRPYKDVFYTFTALYAGTYTLDMCGSDNDTHMRIWSDGTCGTVLADGGSGCTSNDPVITLSLTAGQQIWIECGNRHDYTAAGDYNFNLSGPPAGEVCGTALPLAVPDTKTGNTCNFDDDINITCDGTASAGKDVVYAYTSPTYQRVTFSLCGSSYDTKLYIFDGSCDGAPLACNENSSTCSNHSRSHIACLWLEPGHTYYVVVDGRNREDGGEAERCDCGNYCLTTVLCGEPPFSSVDMGDLPLCNYPTLVDNPGHGISGIAWLGLDVNGETSPNYNDADGFDDGVECLDKPWTPCQIEQVRILVTQGPNYPAYADTGGKLYLNGWKDGNLDGDFCDEFECATHMVSEWIVKDLEVVPSLLTLDIEDPGVLDQGIYDGRFRWRLTHKPVGAEGFGLIDRQACGEMTCGTFDLDYLGEVEDHIVPDLQLFVELDRFDAIPGDGHVTLRWNTLAESHNDRFEILRDGVLVRRELSAGSSPSGHNYEWVDEGVEAGVVYTYGLNAVDLDGAHRELATAQASLTTGLPIVSEYALYQNYPNPFNPVTQIAFDLLESGQVTLRIYNLTGQVVATLVNGSLESGRHEVRFDATGLPSGVYLYKLEASGFSAVHKMLLTK